MTFTYGRLQREKSARRQGHPCLRFVHDFVSVVFNIRNSCGLRHFSTERTAMRPLRGQNFLRDSLKYCFDLYSSISGESSPFNPIVFNLFTQRFSLVPCCGSHCLVFLLIITRKSGLPGGTVASFNRFLGVPLFGAKIGGCTPFWRSPLK